MVPFESTGWGKALRRGPKKEIEDAMDGMDFFHHFIEKTSPDYIFDFHAASDKVLNRDDLPAYKLDFGRLDDDTLAKRGGIPYGSWKEKNDRLPNGFSVEIPQVFKRSSGRFVEMIRKRTGMEMNYDDTSELSQKIESRFMYVCDRTKSLMKYPPEIIAGKIVDGISIEIF